MTVDPKVFAIATMFVDQLLDEIGPAEYAFSSVERNRYIEQVATELQQTLEYELIIIRARIRSSRMPS